MAAVVWLVASLQRTEDDGRAAVLDSRLGLVAPRLVLPGWHLVPPGLLRLSRYPVRSATLHIAAGEAGRKVVTREGSEVAASLTLRYGVEPERVLELHTALGPDFETRALERWAQDALRRAVGASSYADISGTHADDLQAMISRSLADRFRGAGLVLLACEVADVRLVQGARRAGETPRPGRPGRVLLVGLDGADWNVVDPLLAAGRMPRLARLVREGVRARIRTISPMLSPVIWTSIATGVVPARHGILDFVSANGLSGERVPVRSTERRVKAIWNILTESGLTTGVVGWWATWPAEPIRGFVVSDRVAYQILGSQAAGERDRTGKVHPADADDLVVSLTVAPESITPQDLAPFLRLPADGRPLPADQSRMVDEFRTVLASSRTYVACATALAAREHPDLTLVYLEGTDTVGHLFMPYAPPPMEGVDPEARERFSRVVDAYYAETDALLGRLLDGLTPDIVVVVSDHGFRTGDNRPLTDSRIGYGQAADWHRKYGILVLSGRPFRRGAVLDEASVLDVTPTLLRLFDLPVGEDMDGRPIVDAFDPVWIGAHPESYIPSWEGTGAARPAVETERASTDARDDEERLQKLRDLGYIAGPETGNAHNNRGTVLLGQGRYDEAIAEFDKAKASKEDAGIATINLARAYYKKKDYERATQILEQILAGKPGSKEAEHLLGSIALDQGRLPEAEGRFRKALDIEPHFTDARNSLGLLLEKQGRHEEALQQFRQVVAIDPDYGEGWNNIGVLLKNGGKPDDAIAAFKKAIAADASFAGSYSNLAIIEEERHDYAAAEEHFRAALHRDPNNHSVRTNYGGLLFLMGRLEDARRELETVIREDPNDASAYNNLGAVFGKTGQSPDEVAAYRKAVALDPRSADVHHNLGLALIKAGSGEDGERELRRAIVLDGHDVPAYLNLGRYLVDQGRGEESLDLLRQATAQEPRNPDLRFLLGEAALRFGSKRDAIAAFQEVLRLRPEDSEARKRLETLLSSGDEHDQ